MKNKEFIPVISIIVIVLVLLGMAFLLIHKSVSSKQEFVSSPDTIEVYINEGNRDIIVEPSDDNMVHITYYGNGKSDAPRDELGQVVYKSKQKSSIFGFLFNTSSKKTVVKVPKNILVLNVLNDNGDSTIKSINNEDLAITVHSENGDVSIEDVKVYLAETYLDNGDVSIKADLRSLIAKSKNGDIHAKLKGEESDYSREFKEDKKYYNVRSENGDAKVDFYK
ncbi:Uncharacterised protein [[Eubacterium] infirmum]|nr:Uncharacterised protein [[Eubacterium] infirmum]